jgi:hypothetical protein
MTVFEEGPRCQTKTHLAHYTEKTKRQTTRSPNLRGKKPPQIVPWGLEGRKDGMKTWTCKDTKIWRYEQIWRSEDMSNILRYEGRMEGKTDGWKDEWTEGGRKKGWTDGRTNRRNILKEDMNDGQRKDMEMVASSWWWWRNVSGESSRTRPAQWWWRAPGCSQRRRDWCRTSTGGYSGCIPPSESATGDRGWRNVTQTGPPCEVNKNPKLFWYLIEVCQYFITSTKTTIGMTTRFVFDTSF